MSDYVCKASIEGYGRAVEIGQSIAKSCHAIYIKSILVEDCHAHDYDTLKGSKYFDY